MIKRCIEFTNEEFREIQKYLKTYPLNISYDSPLKEIIMNEIGRSDSFRRHE